MKPGYGKNTVIIGCFFPSRCRQIYIAKKIEFPPDVDKTSSGGNFVFLEDKFEIPDGESMNKRFFRLKKTVFLYQINRLFTLNKPFISTKSLRLFKFSL